MTIQGHRIYDETGSPINATNRFPVDVQSITISTITSDSLAKATTLKIYEKVIDTVGSFLALTITAKCFGFTVDLRPATTTVSPLYFDMAMTSTGTPFNRTDVGFAYSTGDVILPTNTVLYFSIPTATNSTIQVISKE